MKQRFSKGGLCPFHPSVHQAPISNISCIVTMARKAGKQLRFASLVWEIDHNILELRPSWFCGLALCVLSICSVWTVRDSNYFIAPPSCTAPGEMIFPFERERERERQRRSGRNFEAL